MKNGRTSLRRGDVVLVRFPFTDLSGSKRRPALVLQINPQFNDVLLAFISSTIPDTPSSHDFIVSEVDEDFGQNGLKVTSVIRLNKLATLNQSLVTRRLGHLSNRQLSQVDAALVLVVGIDPEQFAFQERKRLANILHHAGVNALVAELTPYS